MTLLRDRQRVADLQGRADRDAKSYRQRYRRDEPEDQDPKQDLSCDAVLAAVPEADRPRLSLTPGLPGFLAMIANACAARARADAFAAETDRRLDALHGLIGREQAALQAAERRTTNTPSPRISAFPSQIRRAATFAETGSASAQLADFRKTLRETLGHLSEATRVAALDGVSSALDALLKGEICNRPAVTAEAKTEAGCTAPAPAAGAAATPPTAADRAHGPAGRSPARSRSSPTPMRPTGARPSG